MYVYGYLFFADVGKIYHARKSDVSDHDQFYQNVLPQRLTSSSLTLSQSDCRLHILSQCTHAYRSQETLSGALHLSSSVKYSNRLMTGAMLKLFFHLCRLSLSSKPGIFKMNMLVELLFSWINCWMYSDFLQNTEVHYTKRQRIIISEIYT